MKILGDRFFINELVSTAATGIYTIGFQLSSLVSIVSISASRAFVPVFMSTMKQDETRRRAELAAVGTTLAFSYSTLAAAIAIFGEELTGLICGAEFQEAAIVVPLLSFAAAANGIFQIFATPLFYEPRAVKWVGIVSVSTMALSLVLNACLIPRFGILGAALAALSVAILGAGAVAWAAHSYSRVRWAYGRIAVLYCSCLAVCFLVEEKSVALILALPVASTAAWGNPLRILFLRKGVTVAED